MSADDWKLKVIGVIAGPMDEPGQPRRQGAVWTIGLRHGDERLRKVSVKTILNDDTTPETRADQEYQAQNAMHYLHGLLQEGWTPDKPGEHTIYIGNPRVHGSADDSAPVTQSSNFKDKKPWWRFW
ncbi:MAG: hypothetical protein NTZ11_14735 [Gammaproteobacteria bacterium]|nr:hypothetical protein [Gammaproteobacteria bacterium]